MIFSRIVDTTKVTELATKLLQETRGLYYAESEIEAYNAPSECFGLVHKGSERRVRELLEEYGYASFKDFIDALCTKVSDKWIYNSAIGMVSPED